MGPGRAQSREWLNRPMGALIRLFAQADFPGICLLEMGERGAQYPACVFIRQASVLYPKTFLVALENGEPAGYCIGAMPQDNYREAWILRLRVSAPYRRRHIGSDLLSTLLAEFKQKEVSAVQLSVAPGNTGAQALYRLFGFEVAAFHKGYFGDGEDRLIMALRLDQPCRT
ncbi:MAG: GNAT family N-acetyltransferase [Methanoregulaceae archaeon]|nr:GNAT family N-acetyltransferase [Methanoregulaceae archaeon]